MRKCIKCGVEYLSDKNACEICRNKQKAKDRDYYVRNRTKILAKARTYREQNKDRISENMKVYRNRECNKKRAAARTREYRLNHPTTILLREERQKGCEICNSVPFHLGAIELHHKDPATKSFHLSSATQKHSYEAVVHELGKCVRLCSSCHLVVHAITSEMRDPVAALNKLRSMADEIRKHNTQTTLEGAASA